MEDIKLKNKRSDRVTIATTHFTATDDPAGFAIDNNLPTTNIIPSFFLLLSFLSISGLFVSMAHKCHPADGWIDQRTYTLNVICQAKKKQPRLFSFLEKKENSHALGGDCTQTCN